jgi:MFS family permease
VQQSFHLARHERACDPALLACALPISLEWYFSWRFLSGVATGATIVLVAATFLPHVPADRKGVASGLIFVGLGLGIAATGTLVPFLLRFGLRATWIWLALFAGALTVSTWTFWPPSEFVSKRQELTHHRQARSRPDSERSARRRGMNGPTT